MENNVFKKNAPRNLYLVTTDDGWIDARSKELGKNLVHPDLARFEGNEHQAETVRLYLY